MGATIFALDPANDGALLWRHRLSQGTTNGGKPRSPWPACSFYYGQSAAALDGKLRMLDADSGKLLHLLDTKRAYATRNGIEGHGGAIDLSGVNVSGRRLFLLSGYGVFGQMPGNLLLAYALADED